jgi:hypothetical protein
MELIFWYIFWIVILVIAIILVSFPGWGPCEQWFQKQLYHCGSSTWLYLWALVLVGLAAAGWAGDPSRNVDETIPPWCMFMYRTWYGFLLLFIFLWWLSFFGGRNLAVATLTALFGMVMGIVMVFLTRNRIAQFLYVGITLWFGVICGYSLSMSRLNWNNSAATFRLF